MRAWADTLETASARSRSKAPADVVTSIRAPVLDAIEKARTRLRSAIIPREKKRLPPAAATPAAPAGNEPPKG
jgi:hypothetical protein